MKKIIIGIVFLLMGLGVLYAQDSQMPPPPPSDEDHQGMVRVFPSTLSVQCGKSEEIKALIVSENMTPIFTAQDGAKTIILFVNPENQRWVIIYIPARQNAITCFGGTGTGYLKEIPKLEQGGSKI